MSKVKVSDLRYAAVGVPEYDKQVEFYEKQWGLEKVASDGDVTYFAAAGSPEQYVLRIRKSSDRRVDLVGFGVENAAGVDQLAGDLASEGVQIVAQPGQLQTPGGGYGFRFFDPDGRVVEISADVERRKYHVLEYRESVPAKLSHIVLNSPNPQLCMEWYEDKLGFKLSGWLGDFFGFLRCWPDFHNLAFVKNADANLHHISFEMRGYDEYLRGTGKLVQAGVPMAWGVGKHTPADSSFSYFIDPNGYTTEYTAPQEKIVDSQAYKPPVWGPGGLPNAGDVWGTAGPRNMPEDLAHTGRTLPKDPGLWVAPPV